MFFMKPSWIIGIILIILVLLFVFAVLSGFITIPGLGIGGLNPNDPDAPPGASYCDYTDMQILDMLETASGKDLDNAVGISFVRSLNMRACGSDGEPVSNIKAFYRDLYSDWYVSDDDTASGAGWTAHRVVWLNSENASDATMVRAVLIGEGTTVKTAYGYDTITIVSDGPVVTYGAFMIWVATS